MDFSKPATPEHVQRALAALKNNGFDVHLLETGEDAAKKIVNLIPKGAQVMTMTSITLEKIGVLSALNESGDYDSVRKNLNSMDRATQGTEMRKLGASPDWVVGSANAVTEDGKVLVASATGSQLAAYSYGSAKVIWVVGVQKIVKDLEEGLQRIHDYILPLESERAKKAYGVPGSAINKMLIFNREMPGRITILLVNQSLGY